MNKIVLVEDSIALAKKIIKELKKAIPNLTIIRIGGKVAQTYSAKNVNFFLIAYRLEVSSGPNIMHLLRSAYPKAILIGYCTETGKDYVRNFRNAGFNAFLASSSDDLAQELVNIISYFLK